MCGDHCAGVDHRPLSSPLFSPAQYLGFQYCFPRAEHEWRLRDIGDTVQLIFSGTSLLFFSRFFFQKVVLTGKDVIFTIGGPDSSDGSGSGSEEGVHVISAKSIVTDIADVSLHFSN